MNTALRRLVAAVAWLGLLAAAAPAAARETAADFDYYVFSLSWSPQYCAESRRRDELQCARPYAFVAHGLWPQYEQGYPRDCDGGGRVGEATIERLLPIMPSRGLIIHEWTTHGRCSGLAADDYFAAIERAWRGLRIPARYTQVDDYLRVDAEDFRRALLDNNPALQPRSIVLQCSGWYLQEVRVCLDPRLKPRACSNELRDRCGERLVLRPRR